MAITDEQKNRLFKAAEVGEVEEYRAAATAVDEDIRQLHADNGANCLHIAAYAGQTDLCGYLLDDLKFDINSRDGTGSTPLVLAINNEHYETAELLLSHGPDVNLRGTAEAAAAPLHLAVAAGQLGLAQKLIAAGANVNAQSGSGSPLMLAAARSNAAMIELLLGAGADANEASSKGLSPLFMAIALGSNLECVELLVKAGADVNARALGAFTPLHVAAEGGKAEVAEVLLKAGADPEARDEHGHSPARVAGMRGHRRLVELLLPRGSSGSGGDAALPSNLDAFMKSSMDDLKAREEKAEASTAAAGDASGASVVRIPEPEVPDEALADTFKRKGNEFFVSGDYEGAAKLYDISLSHWTKNPIVWCNRAACYLRLKKIEKALQDAQIARSLDPKYVKAWYREGRAAEGLKRYEDAATAFYQAAQLQPDNEEFIRLTKEAIVEGRKAHQAQQAQQAQQQAAQQPETPAAAAVAAAQPTPQPKQEQLP